MKEIEGRLYPPYVQWRLHLDNATYCAAIPVATVTGACVQASLSRVTNTPALYAGYAISFDEEKNEFVQ